MIANDLDEMKNDGPDDDFIIKSGSAQETVDPVEKRLEAAGIEIPHDEPEIEDVYVPEKAVEEAMVSDKKTVDSKAEFLDPIDSEPNIDESEEELFAQIDAFRQKASMITALIREKQHRMDQLESQLHEKEIENLRYQQKLLAVKRDAADRSVALSKEVVAEAAVRAANEAVAKSDLKVSESLKTVEEKVSSMEQSISEGADLGGIKGDIFDKIHDENVRVYRNIQDFMKERDENDDRFGKLEASVKETNAKINLVMLIAILDLLIAGVVLLTVIGVI